MSESRYVVDIPERVKELMLSTHAQEHDEVTYTWRHGYETLKVERDDGGAYEFAGAYHPNDGYCEGGGICKWCGRTLHFDNYGDVPNVSG